MLVDLLSEIAHSVEDYLFLGREIQKPTVVVHTTQPTVAVQTTQPTVVVQTTE